MSTLLMIWNIVNRIYPLKEHPITMSGGRRSAAQALLSEVYLTRASMEGITDYYQMCVDYCERVIDSEVYDLVDNYKDLWFAFNAEAKNNQESILSYNMHLFPVKKMFAIDNLDWVIR